MSRFGTLASGSTLLREPVEGATGAATTVNDKRRELRTRRIRIQMALALAAIVMYSATVTWGLPHATAADRTKTFATDAILPLEALAEMHNTLVISKPDRNYGYPWFHYFVVAAAQAPYVGLLMLTDQIESIEPVYSFGMRDPVSALRWLTLIGRAVTLLMAVGVVLATYTLAATLWGQRVGAVAGAHTLVNYPMLYYSGTGNLDVPMTLWTTLGVVCFVKILSGGMTRARVVGFGVFAALAMATKDQALVIFLPLGLALLSPRVQGGNDGKSVWQVKPLLVGLGASIAVYVAATGMLIDPARHLTHVYRMIFQPELLSIAGAYFPAHPRTLAGFLQLSWEFAEKLGWALSVPALAAAIVGLVLAGRSDRRLLLLLTPLPTLFVMLSLPIGFVLMRYFLPLVPIFDAFAAFALVRRMPQGAAVRVIPLVLVLGWRALIGIDLAYAQLWETRTAAGAWLSVAARPGDRVEYFGAAWKLPPLGSEVLSRRIAGREDWMTQFDHGPAVIDYLAGGGPEFVLVIPDWTSFPDMERSADCPPEVFAALLDGSLGYHQAAYFPRRTMLPWPFRRPPLDSPAVGPPVRIFQRDE